MQDDPEFLEFEIKPELIQKMTERAERQKEMASTQEQLLIAHPNREETQEKANITEDI